MGVFVNQFLFRVGLAIKRIPCLLRGCKEGHESNWNMPDDWSSPTYCKRCDAQDDVYGFENTPWPVLYDGDKFLFRLRNWLVFDSNRR